MRAFDAFVEEMDVDSYPPSCEDMRLFAAWLMLHRVTKHSSLKQYLSAVKVHFGLLGFWVPAPSDYPPLKAVVDGSRRVFSGPVRRSAPVTVPILRNLLATRPPRFASWGQLTTLRILKDCAILLFVSMVRSSSLFPPFRAAADARRNLVWDRVQFRQGAAVISVTLAKTNQFLERTHTIVLQEVPGSPCCPVAALRRLRAVRGEGQARPGDFVFQLPTGNSVEEGWRLLVKTDFLSWFRKRVRDMGLDETLYMLHGFRRGGISLAVSQEPNLALIKLQSDHSSEAVWSYIELEESRRRSVARLMVEAVDRAGRVAGQADDQ